MPETRLIDVNKVRLIESDSDAYIGEWNEDYEKGFLDAINKVLQLPTISAQPVKHGKWVRAASGELYCSYCMYEPKWDDDKFCANCGAKMDGGGADETP